MDSENRSKIFKVHIIIKKWEEVGVQFSMGEMENFLQKL